MSLAAPRAEPPSGMTLPDPGRYFSAEEIERSRRYHRPIRRVGLLSAALVVVLSFLGPVLFEPMFNRFRPLEDAALSADLQELASRAGVPVRRVLVTDASRRTRKENAYVSGLSRTRRIVVYDTLLNRASPQEIGLVVAHELGHWRDRHVVRATVLGAIATSVGVVVLFVVLRFEPLLDAI